jgi:tyrosyl-tRNA synthetase
MDVERQARRQLALLKARTVDLLVEEELYRKLCRSLSTGTPLRVKLGLDPTAPDLHIGHTVVIHKLREFQELGHAVIFLIGDFTGLIGDPSGRSETRKPLTADQIQENAETYKRQIFKILDPERTIIEYNSRWGRALGSEGMIRLAAQYTVARMLGGRLSERLPRAAHQPPRVPLPAAAGLRFGGSAGRRRAGRDRPEVQPVGRARAHARRRAGAAGHPDAPDPGGA